MISFYFLKNASHYLLNLEFRRFLQTVREIQSYWKETLIEAQRLQRELDMLQQKFEECMQERSNFETKLFHARRLLEAESRAKRQLVLDYKTIAFFVS